MAIIRDSGALGIYSYFIGMISIPTICELWQLLVVVVIGVFVN